jgi:hypothetical protein
LKSYARAWYTHKSLEVLFFVLTLAVVWTLKVSQSLRKEIPLKKATHGRKRVSFFRRGLSAIRHSINNLAFSLEKLISYCHLIISDISLEPSLKGVEKSKPLRILSKITCGAT